MMEIKKYILPFLILVVSCNESYGQGLLLSSGGTGRIPLTLFGMHNSFGGCGEFTPCTSTWPTTTTVGAEGKGSYTAWHYIEYPRGTYNWTQLDAKVAEATANGVDLFYSIDGTPNWALSDQSTCGSPGLFGAAACAAPPDSETDTTDFFAAVATRYCGTALKYIELYNEPYVPGEAGAPGDFMSASDLATFTSYEYNAIRANCPSMKIITPSMDGGYMTYASDYFTALSGMSSPALGVDIASIHSYPDNSSSNCSIPPYAVNNPESLVLGNYANPTELHTLLTTYLKPNIPLWNTEGSWNNNSPDPCFPTLASKAGFASRWYLLQWANGIKRAYWYGWDDGNFGTLDPSLNPPNSSVPVVGLQQTEYWMVGRTMPNGCSVSGTVWTCQMLDLSDSVGQPCAGSTNVIAVWDTSGSSSFTPPSSSIYSKYCDLTGGTTSYGGSGAVTIGIEPILFAN